MNRVFGVCIGTKPMAAFGLLPSSMARAEQGRAQAPATVRVELGPAQVARWLTLATAAVVGSCVFVTSLSIVLGRPSMFGLMPVFDLDREATIPAGYTALLLLSSAILLILVARIERLQGDQRWFYWAILSLGFVYLAADELVALHERFNRPLRYLLGASPRAATWMIAGTLGALAAGIFFLPFLRTLPARHAARFVVAGVVYVGSAVGLEMVAAALGHGPDDGVYDWVTLGQVTLEEGGEMVGVALFIHALVDYLRAAGARLELRF
jgi:hypothetical protein